MFSKKTMKVEGSRLAKAGDFYVPSVHLFPLLTREAEVKTLTMIYIMCSFIVLSLILGESLGH